MNIRLGILWWEQEGQNQEPLGTETRMGLRQKRWNPLSHLSQRRSSSGKSPDPHFSHRAPSKSGDSYVIEGWVFGFGASVLRLSIILFEETVGADCKFSAFRDFNQGAKLGLFPRSILFFWRQLDFRAFFSLLFFGYFQNL